MKQVLANKSDVKSLPEVSGVYIYKDETGKIIYVGKAKNLKNRVGSYFSNNLAPKTQSMVASARTISYIPVSSELEALLLEAKLVKKNQPKFNSELRDDKSPLYIGITNEVYPRVVTLRQTQLQEFRLKKVYGPFINSGAPKQVLRYLRRVFTFSSHKPGKRACVYHQIGLCNPCPSDIVNEKDEAKKLVLTKEFSLNLRRLNAVLSGKSQKVLSELTREMEVAAKLENYEEASELKNKIAAFTYVLEKPERESSYIENPNLLDDIRSKETNELHRIVNEFFSLQKLRRIECFDIAHLAGSYPTASMVTFIKGEPDKTLYRHYKVSEKKKNDDVGSMKAVLVKRRARFATWGKPDLLIVDGGKGQVAVAQEVMQGEVAVVGLAKRFETLIFENEGTFQELRLPEGPAKNLVQRIRNEAHRFARRYHHNLVSRAIKEA